MKGRREPSLVGDIRTSHPANAEYYETVLRLLEEFMVEHRIDRIDVGWSRERLLSSQLNSPADNGPSV